MRLILQTPQFYFVMFLRRATTFENYWRKAKKRGDTRKEVFSVGFKNTLSLCSDPQYSQIRRENILQVVLSRRIIIKVQVFRAESQPASRHDYVTAHYGGDIKTVPPGRRRAWGRIRAPLHFPAPPQEILRQSRVGEVWMQLLASYTLSSLFFFSLKKIKKYFIFTFTQPWKLAQLVCTGCAGLFGDIFSIDSTPARIEFSVGPFQLHHLVRKRPKSAFEMSFVADK